MPPVLRPDGVINGTDADEVIDASFVDADGDQIDNPDQVFDGRGPFDDVILAGAGNDTVVAGRGDDLVSGEDGDDLLYGGAGNDTLVAGRGDDTLIGGSGDDIVVGDSGNNLMYGDGPDAPGGAPTTDFGNDTLVGGRGNDTMYGGGGDDDFIIQDLFGNHVIVGGEEGEVRGDLIDATGMTEDVVMQITGNEQGTITNGSSTVNYEEIELIRLGSGDDLVEVVEPSTGKVNGGEGFDTLVIPGFNEGGENDPQVTITLTVTNPDGTESYDGFVVFSDGTRLEFQKFEKIICFTPGTLIDTDRGPRAVETLVPGDLVLTRDHGFRPLAWTGAKDLPAAAIAAWPDLAPVRIAAGALGQNLPARDLVVSPRHRMLVSGPRAEIMFGEREVLVAAQDLVGLPGITRDAAADTTYLHIMCEGHEILRAEGAWTESFQPAAAVLGALDDGTRAEILRLFPELATAQGQTRFAAARPVLSPAEAKLLVA
jgi:hypothetical protein